MLTKKHWVKILTELKSIRATNKFNNACIIYKPRYPFYKGLGFTVYKINIAAMEILLHDNSANRKIRAISFDDVMVLTPSQIKNSFEVSLNVFSIDKVQFRTF